MAAIVKPAGVRTFANKRVFWVPTLTEGAPTAAQINAGTVTELTQLLYAEGTGRPGADVGRVNSPRRVGSSTVEESFATVTRNYGDLLYSEDPQGDGAAAANEARENLTPWDEGFLVGFPGMSAEDGDASTAIIAGVKGRYYKAQLGPQIDDQTGDGEGDEFAIRQPVSIKGDPVRFTLA